MAVNAHMRVVNVTWGMYCDTPLGFMQTLDVALGCAGCVWTASATCSAINCTDKCLANVYPAPMSNPMTTGVGNQHDATMAYSRLSV